MAATGLTTQQERTDAPVTITGANSANAEGSSLGVARADHQHATLYTAAGGTARTFASKFGEAVSVKDFGAAGDGSTDDTAAFKSALSAAAGKTLYVPPGTYLLTPTSTRGNAIQVPDDTTLVGEGRKSVLKVKVAAITVNTRHYLITYGSRTRFYNFELDGRKGDSHPSGLTAQVFGISPTVTTGTDDVICEKLWVHDISGSTTESFGFVTGGGTTVTGATTNVVVRNCWGWNCDGTPFSFDGAIDATNISTWDTTGYLTDGVTVENVIAYGNTWQGLTCYGAKNVRISGCKLYSNSLHGLNLEWVRNVQVMGLTAYSNTYSGLGTFGKADFVLRDSWLYSNNTANNAFRAEIRLEVGSWFTGTARGYSGDVEIRDCLVQPSGSNRHVYFGRDATVTIDGPHPSSVSISGPDVENWRIGGGDSNLTKQSCLRLRNIPMAGRAAVSVLGDWVTSGVITNGAYGGTGNLNAGARTLTTTDQYAGIVSKSVLEAGGTYRVRVRWKAGDTNARWMILGQEGTGSNQTLVGVLDPTTFQVGTWLEHHAVVTIPTGATEPYRLQIQRDSATGTSSTVHVDYVEADLIEGVGQMPSVALDQLAGRCVGYGSAAPTAGNHNLGDLWLNTAPANRGNVGWVCTAAGRPGTWLEFGHINTDTDTANFGTITANTAGSVFKTNLEINDSAATNRQITFKTSNSHRWYVQANNTAESGSNAGTDLVFSARADDGVTAVANPVYITRADNVLRAQSGVAIGASGAWLKKHLSATATWDPASLAAGQYDSTTVTVTGAAVGDTVNVGFSNAVPAGCLLFGAVTASGTVTVTLLNVTTGTVDLASGTLRADVWQH